MGNVNDKDGYKVCLPYYKKIIRWKPKRQISDEFVCASETAMSANTPVSFEEANSSEDRNQWIKAMNEEMSALSENET